MRIYKFRLTEDQVQELVGRTVNVPMSPQAPVPVGSLHGNVKKPAFSQADRLWFVFLTSRVRNWKESLLVFKPDTLLRWHRQDSRAFWELKSRHRGGRPRLDSETVTLIQQTWAILLKNHAKDIWACDFLPVIDLWFRPLSLLHHQVGFPGSSSFRSDTVTH